MGRIDRSQGQDATLERRHIEQMLRHIDEYEQVKSQNHPSYRYAWEFYESKGLCKQNFLKYYRRYIINGRSKSSLIPHKTGRKFKDALRYNTEVLDKLKEIRSRGYNRYDIAQIMNREGVEISSSTVYRLMKKLGINKLNPRIKEEIRRIIKMSCGELGHMDIHYISKGTVRELGGNKDRLYILGVIDSYSRVCWLEVLDNIKALNVSLSMVDILVMLRSRYGIEFKEMMTDNGSEFSSRNNIENHPVERMLSFLDIKHRYTKPCTPKTNGKIERFWRSIEEELLSGETFETVEEFKNYIRGYCIYYNEHRLHQGINIKKPVEMTKNHAKF